MKGDKSSPYHMLYPVNGIPQRNNHGSRWVVVQPSECDKGESFLSIMVNRGGKSCLNHMFLSTLDLSEWSLMNGYKTFYSGWIIIYHLVSCILLSAL